MTGKPPRIECCNIPVWINGALTTTGAYAVVVGTCIVARFRHRADAEAFLRSLQQKAVLP